MRVLLALVVILVALGLGGTVVYCGSPYYAVWRLETAARSGASGEIAALTDMVAVNANLSPALAKTLTSPPEAAPPRRRSFFGRLGRFFARAVRPTPTPPSVSPERLAALIRSGSPFESAQAIGPGASTSAGSYVVREGFAKGDLDDFHVLIGNYRRRDTGVALTLVRRGFLTWRIIAVDLLPLAEAQTLAPAANAAPR